jgi:hypothetical protein
MMFLSRLGLLLTVFVFAGMVAIAQQTLGTLNGSVLDSSGAAIPNSIVTVSDPAIGVTRTATTQGNGFYQIFNLPVGVYGVQATHDGFNTTKIPSINVREAQATTLNVTLKVGETTTSVEVTANPLLNSTDATNGYTMDAQQIEETPLATGSFTQLATLSPSVNAELLSGIDTNAGLGNQPIWANGQRDTSNTFQVNGVDTSNLFNGKTSSNSSSQRYQFNIGQGTAVGGETQTSGSVFGSNGNSLPTPPPEFLQELRVNASMYDAQQGMTSGAQIDANTKSGTNSFHGQIYGSIANNAMNSAPFFFRQDAILAEQGVGEFPSSLANPALHRWTTGGTLGGPIMKDKLFFFVAYQHLYSSDQSTGLSQLNVPSGLTNDRSAAGLTQMEAVYNAKAGVPTLPAGFTLDPTAAALFQATVPGGGYLIPTPANANPYQPGVYNVTLAGTSMLVGDQAETALDYDVSQRDRLSFKYYYQNDPLTRPFGVQSRLLGFPGNTYNGAQVGALDNTISIGSHLNWEQRLGYSRSATYSGYSQTVNSPSGLGPNFGTSNPVPGAPDLMPGYFISEIAAPVSGSPSLSWGPESTFTNTGYFQNRLNPSSNVIYQLGKHTIVAGGGYSYTQLNIENNRNGLISADASNLTSFLEGSIHSASTLETIGGGHNLANRYYRTNEGDGYLQDQWRILSGLTLTGGARWDYHGGFIEKYGNFFNFDPNAFNVTGTDPGVGGAGFTVINDGLVVAGNNPTAPTKGASASTLAGRQWGISPRIGFAWAPKWDNGKFVVRGGFGLYYDRGELFTYLSPPAGGSVGGPFGVTQQSPLVAAVSSSGTVQNPLGSAGVLGSDTTPPAPSVDPTVQFKALQNQLNYMTRTASGFGLACGGVGNLEDDCLQTPLYIGAYDKSNVLPYTMNFSLNVEWQPRPDMSVTIGYSGNRGRHAVIPIPFNEPQVATPTKPAMILGATPHSSDEIYSYGYDVMNGNAACGKYDDPCPIASEPWSTYDGGNSDFRVAYPGYSPYAALFQTKGNSAYDSLETHVEKRMKHNIQFGGSYTYGHALDEQSDIGLFFTGNDPAHLRNSWASADYDRTHVFTGNFVAQVPNTAAKSSLMAEVTNDWSLSGIATLQSGEPYSLYEYNGAVASAQLGYYPSLINPILPIANPHDPKSALTGNPGRFRGPGGSYIPAIDPTQIQLQYLAPGEGGVPPASAGGPTDPADVYETAFSPVNQRNIFRQAPQYSLQLSLRKQFRINDRINLRYGFNVFNVLNHTSMDVPQNGVQIAQHGVCANSAQFSDDDFPGYDCSHGYEDYGMVITSQQDQASGSTTGAPPNSGTAGTALYKLPYSTGTGKSTMLPTTIPDGQRGCTTVGGCSNFADTFGSVTTTIGSARMITMDLHIVF